MNLGMDTIVGFLFLAAKKIKRGGWVEWVGRVLFPFVWHLGLSLLWF